MAAINNPLSRLVFATLISLALAGATLIGAEGKKTQKAGNLPVSVLQSWNGKVTDQHLRKFEPPSGFTLEKEAWSALWKAWRGQENVPVIDFEKQMVLVHVAEGPNNVGCSPSHDGKGNIRAIAMSTLMAGPGFGYLLQCIAKEGVRTVNGKPLPGVKAPPARPKASQAESGTAPGAAGDVSVSSSDVAQSPGVVSVSQADAAPQLGPIKKLESIAPKTAVFKTANWNKPLVLNSEKQAGEYFADEALAQLKKQADFTRQIVLVFAWRGSGQDRLDAAVVESYPEQIFFTYKPGRTRDLREHVEVYVLRSNVRWSVR